MAVGASVCCRAVGAAGPCSQPIRMSGATAFGLATHPFSQELNEALV